MVIHHIKKWSKSFDHSEKNLVVLCVFHHGEAHTKRDLNLNLTIEQIIAHKEKWIEQVKFDDANTIANLAHLEGARWDYINHNRLFELMDKLRIDPTNHRLFDALLSYGIVHKSGFIIPHNRWTDSTPTFYLYDVGEGMYLYSYTSHVLDLVLRNLPIIDVTNHWSKKEILLLVKSGCWIALQSAFYFKKLKKGYTGIGQERRGLRRRDGITLEFIFDSWDATSSSSKILHLSGYQTSICLLFVKSIFQDRDDNIKISASCMAIGSNFKDYRELKNYRPPPSYRHLSWEDEEYEEEDESEL